MHGGGTQWQGLLHGLDHTMLYMLTVLLVSTRRPFCLHLQHKQYNKAVTVGIVTQQR